ncbi:hypothetical protein GH714_018727 [Hevea brasiliensis]|uniref:Late embryogenesis abundant protein LEA-2 subgroup domain-containing protein n=1 Tax=Hevea brasiliensis TaxID=3981 RepID=A0A6A6K759_HEVBR|nr:hypothetical protein GH714_018628 [Hevea brasiliensis]KAF2284065.1 hypothetical protein GH714_018727 [Hevea brasiliensis]
MEERLPTISIQPTDDPSLHPRPSPPNYEPIFQPRPFPFRKSSFQARSRPLSIESEIYIVQIPKEQIFSVPLPENAITAERYRNPETKESSHRNRLVCVIITLLVVAAIVGLIAGVVHNVFNLETPAFSVVHVRVKNPPSSSHKTSFEITLKAKNRNERTESIYSSDGEITLLYNGHKIGSGKSPEFDQAADSSKKIGLELRSSKGALPEEIERSIRDKMGKRHVSLVLKMNNVPVKMKSWKAIDVVCNLKVSSLGDSESCL